MHKLNKVANTKENRANQERRIQYSILVATQGLGIVYQPPCFRYGRLRVVCNMLIYIKEIRVFPFIQVYLYYMNNFLRLVLWRIQFTRVVESSNLFTSRLGITQNRKSSALMINIIKKAFLYGPSLISSCLNESEICLYTLLDR